MNNKIEERNFWCEGEYRGVIDKYPNECPRCQKLIAPVLVKEIVNALNERNIIEDWDWMDKSTRIQLTKHWILCEIETTEYEKDMAITD